VRLPLYRGAVAYKGTPQEETVWYVLLDASDSGLAHDLGVNYAPKLANIAIGDPEAVQTVTLRIADAGSEQVGQAVVDFPGRARLQPDPDRDPRPDRFSARELPAGRRRRAPDTARSFLHCRLRRGLQRADRRNR